jgi:RNA polymerase sigma-70 factor (ECF subfamily)
MLLRRGIFSRGDRQTSSAGQEVFATEALTYVDQLYARALRLTHRPSDAEDLVQDTYLKAFRAANQFRPGSNLKAWLFTILQNTYRNAQRDRGRDPVDVDSETVERSTLGERDPNAEQRLVATAAGADVRRALDALPPAFREAVWLRDVDELSYAEIAEVLAVPIGTVMSRISRGRRLLHEQLLRQAQESAAPATGLAAAESAATGSAADASAAAVSAAARAAPAAPAREIEQSPAPAGVKPPEPASTRSGV